MSMDFVAFLSSIIAIPSVSRDESRVSVYVEEFMRENGACGVRRYGNNVVAVSDTFDMSRPTLMLNSHLDTVRPSESWTRSPYAPSVEGDRIYGLGSNDAGASVAALTATFLSLKSERLPFNLLLALSVEEEVGGEGGMRLLLPSLATDGIVPDMALVGEPTGMQPAVAERGLVVLDCVTSGVTGHAARNEGVNAIYRAIADIDTVRSLQLPETSPALGPIRFTVTQIEAGRQHNVIPDTCRWVTDIRTTDAYTNEETVEYVRASLSRHTVATPRSTRVRASVIDSDHPLVKAAVAMGLTPFVSPTTSDMSLMHSLPSLKIGPGESARSHSADEYVYISEIKSAIPAYIQLIHNLSTCI